MDLLEIMKYFFYLFTACRVTFSNTTCVM